MLSFYQRGPGHASEEMFGSLMAADAAVSREGREVEREEDGEENGSVPALMMQ